jgi:VIT1/CCC1 family predicted Fe2+/Mn2+ transporter
MPQVPSQDKALGRTLILDELFDLSLYKALREITDRKSQTVLDALILVETEHLAFWQNFFDLKLTTLDLPRRLKLRFMILVCRIIGVPAVHLVLEAIEVHGVRKYLSLWTSYHDKPLGTALRGILLDEFKHEDVLVTDLTERKINPERIRNIFLGLNDGLVEILGAVSGFFAAFGDATTVLIAAATTAVAGSLSMGGGAYAALNSEQEVQQTESAKRRFLGEDTSSAWMEEQPFGSALVVGGSYLAGAMVPVLPVLFGAKDALVSMLTAGSMVILVSAILAFLSGMDIRRRILLNLAVVAAAVGVTYLIGMAARSLWGISV